MITFHNAVTKDPIAIDEDYIVSVAQEYTTTIIKMYDGEKRRVDESFITVIRMIEK